MTRRRIPWTAADIATLRRLYPHHSTQHCAEALGCTVHRINAKAYKLGLQKSPAWLATPGAGRIAKGERRGVASEFKPGHASWNKGIHYTAGGRSVETRFKPGQVSARWDAEIYIVGALRINTDGELEIKTAPGPRQWVRLARYTWETERGPIPKGMIVAVRDDDRHNCADVNNLELLTRAQLMRRNTVHNLPKPLAQLVQLRGALVRKINHRTRKELAP